MEEKDYFTCDYCHRVGTGITIVNGFKMCPMCLAEYQHKSGENNELREELGRKADEVEQLKKENEELKVYNKQLDYWKSEYYNSYDEIRDKYNDLKSAQNKIAIEKLKEYEKNNDYISYKSSKIVFCQDGRIWLIDKDDELVDLRDCENCKQKDQRIAELEKQLAIRDKALELACIHMEGLVNIETGKFLVARYFLEQAEEYLKKAEGENGKTD